LILFFSVSNIFFGLGLVTLLIALMLSRKKILPTILLVLFIVLIAIFGNPTAKYEYSISPSYISPVNQTKLLEPTDIMFETMYGQISVVDTGTIRTLYINNGMMASMDLKNETQIVAGWEYIKCMEIPFAMDFDINNVLNLGLGAGNYPKIINREYGVNVDNVEINEKMVEIAHDYFNLTFSDSIKVYVDDARAFLQDSSKKYDLISIDVFLHNQSGYIIPEHLVTKEFFTVVKNHLDSNGAMVMNFVGDKNGEFLTSEYKTISSVFPSVYTFDCGTQIIVASKGRAYTMDELKQRAPGFERLFRLNYNMTLTNKSIIMTDDYAPITSFFE